MPVVPTTTGRQVESRGFSSPGFAAQSSPNLGDAVTAVGDKYVGALADARQRANVALTQEASLQLNAVGNDLLTNPDTGFLNLQGKNAIGKAQEYTQQFDQQVEQIAAGLPDEQARTAFLQQAQQERMQFSAQAGRHEVGQINAYEEGQFQATLTNSGKKAASMYGDNAAYVSVNKETFQQIEQFGIAHGWSSEQIQAKKIEFKEKSADAALSQWSANNAIGFIESNGELSDTPGGSRRAVGMSGQGAGAARGIRNNNPGNLEASDSNPWQGQTGSDGRFAKFETPEHGIRALGRNLLSYQRQGIDTVNDIITRWAPPEDNNDTAAYIKAVCAQLGVTADQQLDASNPDTLKALCAAIIHHENSSQPYTDQQLSTGVSAAIGLSQLPTSTKRYTGNAAFDAASPEAQATFLRQADQIRKQQQSEYRALLDERVRDASAAYMRGVEFPNAPTQQDFLAGYGLREGNLRYTEFRNNQIAGQYIGSFSNLPTQSIEGVVAGLKPGTDDGGEGYAARAATYDAVVRAAGEVIRQRQADPIQYSLATGQAKPLDLSSQQNFGYSIALRASQINDLSKAYGTPVTFFSKEEASQIGQFFRDAPVSQQSAYLDTIHKSTGGGKTYMAALQQISANAPSAAVAGILMDKPGGVVAEKNWFNPDVSVSPSTASQTILAGAAARKGSKDAKGITMPKENDMRLEFSDTVKDAFAGDAQGASMAYDVAKDYYAGVMVQKGDLSGELDSDVWKQAINVATGGVHDYNGMGNVLLPWGMSSEQFDKEVNQAWETQVTGAGVKAPPGNYGLQSYGDSQYLVKLGTGYLLKPDGSPVIIDLTQQRLRFTGDIPQ
ncbi:hypothetical protein QMS76_03915 [Cronobacter sakazakii]|uniref:hypothetical protein n=1 Tax=Cronobacter sakazakii TaxID=28141 RepID=UPI000A18BA5C|nr:hypothetical protein [Cronobacter sakazakii]EMC4334347.1 hypothetical protein [Cronobacter sakazakii]MDK1113631.1 hypothetical protein [Cronobacter sakazakii]PUY68971.1 hypothetical protein B8W48_04045 [Cronobacter sakazakii]